MRTGPDPAWLGEMVASSLRAICSVCLSATVARGEEAERLGSCCRGLRPPQEQGDRVFHDGQEVPGFCNLCRYEMCSRALLGSFRWSNAASA